TLPVGRGGTLPVGRGGTLNVGRGGTLPVGRGGTLNVGRGGTLKLPDGTGPGAWPGLVVAASAAPPPISAAATPTVPRVRAVRARLGGRGVRPPRGAHRRRDLASGDRFVARGHGRATRGAPAPIWSEGDDRDVANR